MSNILMQFAAKTAAAAFDVENDINWYSLFWSSSSANSGYSNGNAVGTFYNSTAESDFTASGTVRPTFTSSSATLNNQKSLSFDGSDDTMTCTYGTPPSYTSGVTTVVIGDGSGITSSAFNVLVSGTDFAAENRIGTSSTNTWVINAGTGVQGGTQDTNAHLWLLFCDGSTGNDSLDIDGSSVISGSDAGSEQITASRIGANAGATGSFWNGKIALVGYYEGDLRSDGNFASFKTWVASYYGLTIA